MQPLKITANMAPALLVGALSGSYIGSTMWPVVKELRMTRQDATTGEAETKLSAIKQCARVTAVSASSIGFSLCVSGLRELAVGFSSHGRYGGLGQGVVKLSFLLMAPRLAKQTFLFFVDSLFPTISQLEYEWYRACSELSFGLLYRFDNCASLLSMGIYAPWLADQDG